MEELVAPLVQRRPLHPRLRSVRSDMEISRRGDFMSGTFAVIQLADWEATRIHSSIADGAYSMARLARITRCGPA